MLSRGVGISTMLTVALVFSGCQDSSKTVEEYLQSAQEHRLTGDFNTAVIELKSALQKNPDSSAARFMLGQIYLEISDGASAEKELMRARELGMSEEATQLPLAQSWLLQRQHDRILNDLPVPAEGDPEYVRVLVLRGQALLGSGNLEAAEETFDMALTKAPESLEANIGLARVALARGDIEMAQKLQAKAEEMNPDAIESLALKGDVAFLQEDFAQASEVFGTLVKRRPQNLLYRVSQAWAQVGAQEYETAAKSLDTILRVIPNNTQARYLRGVVHYNQKHYTEARHFMERVLAKEANYAPALLVAGASSYVLKEYEQARNHLTRLVNMAPSFDQGRKLLALTQMQLGQRQAASETLRPLMVEPEKVEDEQTLRLVAVAALQSGDLRSGKNYIEKAIEHAPNDARLRAQLGMTRINLGEVDEGLADVETAIGQDTSLADVETTAFLSLLQNGNYERAFQVAKEMQQSGKEPWKGYFLEGMAHNKLGNTDSAKSSFQKALELNPSSGEAAHNLAVLAIQERDVDSARETYQEFLEDHPDNAFIHFQLAKLEALLGNTSEVETHMLKVIELQPESATPRVVLGRVYLEMGQPQDARALVEEVLQDNADDANLLSVLGQAQLASGQNAGAVQTFQRVTSLAPTHGAYYWLAASRREIGDIPGARSAVDRSLSLKNDNMQARLLQGQLAADAGDKRTLALVVTQLRESMGENPIYQNLDASLALLNGDVERAREMMTEILDTAPASDVVVRLARLEAVTGNLDKAEALMGDWLKERPNDAFVRLNLSTLYTATERYGDAQQQLETLLENYPESWAAQNDLAWVLYKQGQFDQAKKYAEGASEAAPEQAPVLDTYGTILLASNNPQKAVITLEKAVRLDPTMTSSRLTLAKAYAQSGRREEALDTVDQLLADFRDFQEQREAEQLKAQLTEN